MSEREIFTTARGYADPAARAAYLKEACGNDLALRKRIERLLRADAAADSILDVPAPALLDTVPSEPPASTPHADAEITPDMSPEAALRFLAPPEQPGALGRMDHYDVLEVIGRGGMGLVLKAFDTKLHRVVAIKVMAPQLAANAIARKRFVREARAGAGVNHKNVVTIHAVEADHSPPYLVMEFVAGRSLEDRIRDEGAPEVKEIVRIGSEIAGGLAAAHGCGLIHRDIKPANILLEHVGQAFLPAGQAAGKNACPTDAPPVGQAFPPPGAKADRNACPTAHVKITDFGLARAVNEARLTQSGIVAGTPRYMSPEQALGQPLDARSDLFSLGGVLYFLCTGQAPFRAGNTLAVLSQVIKDEPQPIRDLNPAVPPWLCDLVAKLQAKNPADRIQSAQEVADTLAQHLAAPPPEKSECNPAPVKRTAPRSRSGAWLAVAGVSVTVTALALVLFFNWGPHYSSSTDREKPGTGPDVPRSGAFQPFSPAVLADRDAFRAPAVRRLRQERFVNESSCIPRGFSPDGKWLVTVSAGDTAVRVWDVATGKQHKELPSVGDITRGPTLSHNGAWLAVYGLDGLLTLWGTQAFTPARTLERQPFRLRSAAFDTEDKVLATGRQDGLVQFWEVATGREIAEFSVGTFPVLGLDFLPGNKRLAVFTIAEAPRHNLALNIWYYDCLVQVLDIDEKSPTYKQPLHQWKAPDTHFIMFVVEGERLYFLKDRYGATPSLAIADAATGTLRELKSLPGVVPVSVLPVPGGRLLAGYEDKVARLWSTESGKVEWEFPLPTSEEFGTFALHPDGKTVAFGADDLTRLHFYDLQARKELLPP